MNPDFVSYYISCLDEPDLDRILKDFHTLEKDGAIGDSKLRKTVEDILHHNKVPVGSITSWMIVVAFRAALEKIKRLEDKISDAKNEKRFND